MKQPPLKKIGIIGGMGPLATLDLYGWIIKLTKAHNDQDHIPTLIYSLPQIPDRTEFLLGGGKDPKPYLLAVARQLEAVGANLIAIPCNTAHVFVEFLQKSLKKAQVIDMIDETRKWIETNFDKTQNKPKIGLLATTGTIETGLYQNYFRGFRLITPNKKIQEKFVMETIYGKHGIKSSHLNNKNRQSLLKAATHLQKSGATLVILGCTEIALALKSKKGEGITFINPTKILAKTLVERAKS